MELVGVLINRITPLYQLCELQVSLLLVMSWYKVMSHRNSLVLPSLNGCIVSLLIIFPPNFCCPLELAFVKKSFGLSYLCEKEFWLELPL